MYELIWMLLRKTVLMVVSAVMCITPLSPPAAVEPEVMNQNTGNYFLPDYGNTLVSSHRSGKGAAPENTLMAVQSNLVYAEGDSAIIEMDVQLTKDGVIVLYHDL